MDWTPTVNRGDKTLVEILVRRIKVGRTDDQHGHFSDCSVADAGWDQNGSQRCHGVEFSIQLDRCTFGTFQYDVNLGLVAMIMSLGVLANAGQMHRTGKLIAITKSAAGNAARTGDRWN